MKLTKDDIEWLDRIGVDSKRMKIIKQNQKLRELIEKRIEVLKKEIPELDSLMEGDISSRMTELQEILAESEE